MRVGKAAKRFLNVSKCWKARTVVGREDGHLLAVSNCFERGAHSHFSFAVTDVAAKQPIHRRRFFEVALNVPNGVELIGRFLKLESVFKFALPVAIGGKRKTLGGFALRAYSSSSWSAMSSSDLRTLRFACSPAPCRPDRSRGGSEPSTTR